MAVTATAQWWIRLAGDDQNSGGYDDQIVGAGTNYANQDAAQLSLTDLTTSGAGVTTLTSATGGFTTAMIGNAIRISSGTNATKGFYFVTGYADTNTVTLDRAPDDGVGGLASGVGKLGGAWGSFHPLVINDTGTINRLDGIAGPIVASNQINVQGTGVDAPSAIDYPNISGSGATAYMFNITSTTTLVKIIGFEGRPYIELDSWWYVYASDIVFQNLKIHTGSSVGINSTNGAATYFVNVVFDNRGENVNATYGAVFIDCEFIGGGALTTKWAIKNIGWFPGLVRNCDFSQWGSLGNGVGIEVTGLTTIQRSVFANLKTGCDMNATSAQYISTIAQNVFYNCTTGLDATSDGISVFNNIFSTNATGFLNTRESIPYGRWAANAYYNNTIDRSGVDVVATDIALTSDPFTNAAGRDFTLNGTAGGGADCKGVGYPATNILGDANSIDVGVIQAGGGGLLRTSMAGGMNG